MSINFISFVISAIFSWFLIRVSLPKLRLLIIDNPNERSSHISPKPRGGGFSFVLISSIYSLIMIFIEGWTIQSQILLFCCPLACIGLIDDIKNVNPIIRYLVHISTALILIGLSTLNIYIYSDFLNLINLLFLILFISAIINFTNFVDGIDGLVGGSMFIVLSSAAFVLHSPSSIWSLIGALAGFIYWNWYPAKIFMGDIGSTFLGAILSGLILQSDNWEKALGLLLIATPILADAFFCVLRRLINGQNIFKAHRLHLYQRLNLAGLSPAKVSSIYILGTILLSFTFIYGELSSVIYLALLEFLFGVFLDQRVAIKFKIALNKSKKLLL